MSLDSNIITIRTLSNGPTTQRRIDLREVPEQVKNYIIGAALVVSTQAGMCRINPEEGDAEAENDLCALEKSILALEQFGDVSLVTS